MKTAFVFPGQGSQFPGMGKDLYGSTPKAASMMERANEVLGFRITDIMFDGRPEDLRATAVTQPAVFLHSVCSAMCSGLPAPDMVGGHSLGEYSALVACGALAFEDALKLVSIRAREMQACCEKVPGAMAAIIGLPATETVDICAATAGMVVAANFNSDAQTVISGELGAVEAACEALKAAGAKKAVILGVGGAFHSPLMAPAAAGLAKAIEATQLHTPTYPIYQNVDARPHTDPGIIKENLLAQLTSPVLWTETIRNMVADGAGSFKEFGPGDVLTGLIKRITI